MPDFPEEVLVFLRMGHMLVQDQWPRRIVLFWLCPPPEDPHA